MWTCPKCHRSFTRPGQSHSCGPYTVEAFLTGKPPPQLSLYRRFEEAALAIGDVVVAPAKGRVGFQHGRIFAAVNSLSRTGMRVHIVTKAPLSGKRVTRVEVFGPACYVNHLTLAQPEEIDAELVGWLRAGYEWGGEPLGGI